MTKSNLITNYSAAIYSIANAEGDLKSVRNQLRTVSSVVEENADLRSALSDKLLPAKTRDQIVEDVFGGKVSDVTKAIIALIVVAGKGSMLTEIIDNFLTQSSSVSGSQLATVRSAVPLSKDQLTKLQKALSKSMGIDVEINNVVDPEIIGGVVTEIGDRIIDGSIRSRLEKVKDSL